MWQSAMWGQKMRGETNQCEFTDRDEKGNKKTAHTHTHINIYLWKLELINEHKAVHFVVLQFRCLKSMNYLKKMVWTNSCEG